MEKLTPEESMRKGMDNFIKTLLVFALFASLATLSPVSAVVLGLSVLVIEILYS